MGAPKFLCDTKNMPRERWLECRAHGPNGDIEYTVGGSDVSVVFGENPWTAPPELWRIKKGLLKPNDAENSWQKEMGHIMEPVVAHWYASLTGNKVIEDTGLYQHADYPYALANLDYRIKDKTGADGLLECKTTSWHKAGDWADGAVPPYYEMQVRFYMAVMDINFSDIVCMWGMNPETDMATCRLHRSRETEAIIFERLDAFIDSLRLNDPPNMSGVAPKLAMEALARIYGASLPDLPTIEFGRKHERALRLIAELQAENLSNDRKARENEKKITELSVKIAEVMGSHEHGILETGADKLAVSFISKTTRRVDSDMLKKTYPDVYSVALKPSVSRKIKVEVLAK